MGTGGWRFAVRRKETSVTSAKEILVQEVERLSEKDAQEFCTISIPAPG
jgi:hypothetical protein